MKCDIEVNWLLNVYCNYDCRYCYCRGTNKKKAFRGDPDTAKIVKAFDQSGLKWLIYMSGGEPFFYPNFIELCKGLTKRHMISINTNLSHNKVYEFADTIDPQRVRCLHISVHIEELQKLGLVDEFIKKYRYLQEKGFYVFASYVMYPAFLQRFDRDYAYFKEQGIILRPKLFRGPYTKWQLPWQKGPLRKVNLLLERVLARHYPQDFSAQEKAQLLAYMDRSQQDGAFTVAGDLDPDMDRLSDVSQDRDFIDGLPSFQGQLCGAGKTFVRLDEKGRLFRCHSDNTYLCDFFAGELKLFDEIQPCRVPHCQCAYIGYKHVVGYKKD